MPCYLHRIGPASQANYEPWNSIGFTGSWEDYKQAKANEMLMKKLAAQPAQDAEITRLRELAATCYATLGAECNLPEN